jgi:hypothetical protein
MMTTMSPEAERLFDRYLQAVRWKTRGVTDSAEIERDVREHVSSALAEKEQPISSVTLREVLGRLGDPWDWIPAEELPFWRRTLMRFSAGPEDWRLAYLCFGMTILGFFLLPFGGAVLLVGAYLLARASYAVARETDARLDAQRWLIAPPLVIVALVIAAFLLFIPAVPVAGWGIGHSGFLDVFDASHFRMSWERDLFLFYAASAAVMMGAWWVLLAFIVAIAVRPLRFLMVPLANGLRPIHSVWLGLLGLVVAGTGASVLLLR